MNRRAGALLAAAVLAAACSGDADESADDGAGGPTTTASATSAPADTSPAATAPAATDDPGSGGPGATISGPGAEVGDLGIDVTVETPDGEVLKAVWFGTANEGAPVVVLAHMRGSGKEAWFPLAAALVDAGYQALAFDLRGYGGSSGTRDTEVAVDVAAAVERAYTQGAVDVVLVGASMGGTAAVVAATQVPVRAVVAVSAPATMAGLDALAAAERLDVPLAVVAGADVPADADAAAALAAAAGVTPVLLPSDAHGTDMLADPDAALTGTLLELVADAVG